MAADDADGLLAALQTLPPAAAKLPQLLVHAVKVSCLSAPDSRLLMPHIALTAQLGAVHVARALLRLGADVDYNAPGVLPALHRCVGGSGRAHPQCDCPGRSENAARLTRSR